MNALAGLTVRELLAHVLKRARKPGALSPADVRADELDGAPRTSMSGIGPPRDAVSTIGSERCNEH